MRRERKSSFISSLKEGLVVESSGTLRQFSVRSAPRCIVPGAHKAILTISFLILLRFYDISI